MEKKNASKRAKAKDTPSKPPKETGGGDARSNGGACDEWDSDPQEILAMGKDAVFDAALRRAKELTAQCAALMRATGYSEAAIAKECAESRHTEISETQNETADFHVGRGIETGEFFSENPGDVVRAVLRRIRRLIESGNKEQVSEGQAYLADVVAEIVGAHRVPKKAVHGWIAEVAGSQSFQSEWVMLRRRASRGVNRTLFTFAFDTLWALNDEIEDMLTRCGVMQARTEREVELAKRRYGEFMESLPQQKERRKMIDAVIQQQFAGWSVRSADLWHFTGSVWQSMRKREPADCAQRTVPVVVEEWLNSPKLQCMKKETGLSRLHPSNLCEEFGKCVQGIFDSMSEYDEPTFCDGMRDLLVKKFA
jgi:hypothetical protein